MALPFDAVVHRKLQELVSRLHQILHQPPPPTTQGGEAEEATPAAVILTDPDDDIEHRFKFLKNLLSLEMESHPGENREHLHHIADWLAFLEDAYVQGRFPLEQALDSVSGCSCTSSCFNEGGDEEEELAEPPNAEHPPADAEPPPEPIVPQSVEESTIANQEHRPTHSKKVWPVGAVALLAAAVALGMVLTNMWAVRDAPQFLLVPT